VKLNSNGNVTLAGQDTWAGHSKSGVAWQVLRGDAEKVLASLAADRFHCAITSPPYYCQRDYKVVGQIGLEPSINEYVRRIADAMDQVKRVLHPEGVLFLNLGDTYYSAKGEPKGVDRKNSARRFGLRPVDASGLGVPRKTAIGIPWRVALEMMSRGWTLRSPIVWHRDAPQPEPTAHDRPWRTYEMLFMLTKQPRYYFRRDQLNGCEDVWTISARPRNGRGLHYAAFPDELALKCLEVGCPPGGEVLDPFAGSGTVIKVGVEQGHPATGIDLSDTFCEHMAKVLRGL
jgi:DNA modification methylase